VQRQWIYPIRNLDEPLLGSLSLLSVVNLQSLPWRSAKWYSEFLKSTASHETSYRLPGKALYGFMVHGTISSNITLPQLAFALMPHTLSIFHYVTFSSLKLLHAKEDEILKICQRIPPYGAEFFIICTAGPD
jgi:hypothetical protein